MDVQEAALLKELVDREGKRVAHAEDGAEGIRAPAQVADLAQELEAVALLLQRVLRWIRRPEHAHRLRLELDRLLGVRGCDELAVDLDAGSGRHQRELAVGDLAGLDHDLQVLEAAVVAQLDEMDALAVAPSLDPAARGDAPTSGPCQEITHVVAGFQHARQR